MGTFLKIIFLCGCLSYQCLFFAYGQTQLTNLFKSEEILELKLKGNVSELFKDRSEAAPYYDFTLSYSENISDEVTLPLRIKVRGNFRRLKENCAYPPLMLNFTKEGRKHSIFSEQDKLKLVMPCQGEKYVIREYLVYKLYSIITSKSFNARLVLISFEDSESRVKQSKPIYGILLEEEKQMAKRNNAFLIDVNLIRPEQTQTQDFLNMAVFQYMIGNTDWSIQYRQNIKLIAGEDQNKPSPVPYDFDHAGIVNTPYAKPAPELEMNSIRERRYRGFCIKDMDEFNEVISRFNDLKEHIFAVYTSSTFIETSYLKSSINYLDDFYKTINNPKKLQNEFHYPCRGDGKGNVVIKGMKN